MQPIEGYGDLSPIELQESPHWYTPDTGDAWDAHPSWVRSMNETVAVVGVMAPIAARGIRPNTSFGPRPDYVRGAPLEPLARSTGPLAPGPVTVSGALSGPSRGFASWTADVRTRQRAEAGRSWLATPEAREGFAEYMAQLHPLGEEGLAPGTYWETEAGPSRSQNRGGPVVFCPPPNATAAQVGQCQAYVNSCNRALQNGQLSPTGRVSTEGQLRSDATAAARRERTRAARAGTPYQGVVGHGPDTTWTNNPIPPEWLDLDATVNSSLGGQCNGYPVGYMPTSFILALGLIRSRGHGWCRHRRLRTAVDVVGLERVVVAAEASAASEGPRHAATD